MSRAVLLLAHGTPDVLGEMAEYLSKVTSGRPMPENVVEELKHRYAQIGLGEIPGSEPPPLTKWTLAQGHALDHELGDTSVYVAMRNWHPYIADVVDEMRRDGVTEIRAICLAPQNSRTSVGLYRKALLSAAAGLEVEFLSAWAEHPLLVQAFAERLEPAWRDACAEAGRKVPVLFTAHSVPTRTVMTGPASIEGARPGTPMQDTPDPYPEQAQKTAALVAERLGLTGHDYRFAFQSQGVSGGPWLGPTVEESLKALQQEGHPGVVIQPVGFVCDHVEVLYDIDIAFKELASGMGLKLWRAESLNDSATLTRALEDLATSATVPFEKAGA
ncbi:ferrochelatase [Edaphobacter albus]|uniref:ferrochelatase n=1 Tax=Edaphobacter sp. 4G125 TaxID=2763071 RepID=UPI001645FECC|nr:ferrochelatase [Edaphobacter sp. 4G125]QNI37480.1 ferrochelatase [Edaphobacter sp. 4G125]